MCADVFWVVHQRTTWPWEWCAAAALQREDLETGALWDHNEWSDTLQRQALLSSHLSKILTFLFLSGFNLFKTFFENVNLCDHRLKRQGTQLVSHMFSCILFLFVEMMYTANIIPVWADDMCRNKTCLCCDIWHFVSHTVWLQCVERLDLAGMDFIWRISMETPDEEIANEAIQLIITYSYTNLNPKMKKVSLCVCSHIFVAHNSNSPFMCVSIRITV